MMETKAPGTGLVHEVFPVGMLACNCSVLGDRATGEAIVVDPGAEIARILEVVERNGLRVTQILVTHAHIDHIAGAERLKELTGAPVLYNQRDMPLVKIMDLQARWLGMATPEEVRAPDESLEDGRVIAIGGLRGEILATPGHTEGSVCLHLPGEGLLLAGDTLFAGGVGRTDWPGGNGRVLIRSIRERLLVLPDETVVVPGHGEQTTIGLERELNPFLR